MADIVLNKNWKIIIIIVVIIISTIGLLLTNKHQPETQPDAKIQKTK